MKSSSTGTAIPSDQYITTKYLDRMSKMCETARPSRETRLSDRDWRERRRGHTGPWSLLSEHQQYRSCREVMLAPLCSTSQRYMQQVPNHAHHQ